MSKYIYATVYEQFTGLKPPEPKSHKPRRRRGYGHPYRMRLNMQENETDDLEGSEDESSEVESNDSIHTIDHKFENPRFSDSFEVTSGNANRSIQPRSDIIRTYSRTSNPIFTSTATPQNPVEELTSHAPKVTYKKRRQFFDKSDSNTDSAEGVAF